MLKGHKCWLFFLLIGFLVGITAGSALADNHQTFEIDLETVELGDNDLNTITVPDDHVYICRHRYNLPNGERIVIAWRWDTSREFPYVFADVYNLHFNHQNGNRIEFPTVNMTYRDYEGTINDVIDEVLLYYPIIFIDESYTPELLEQIRAQERCVEQSIELHGGLQ